MEWLPTTLAMILGILLRIAVPIIVTILFVYLLKKLDERWKSESDIGTGQADQSGNIGCWDVNNCPAEKRVGMQGLPKPGHPLLAGVPGRKWQITRSCIGCDVFRHAPVPVTT